MGIFLLTIIFLFRNPPLLRWNIVKCSMLIPAQLDHGVLQRLSK